MLMWQCERNCHLVSAGSLCFGVRRSFSIVAHRKISDGVTYTSSFENENAGLVDDKLGAAPLVVSVLVHVQTPQTYASIDLRRLETQQRRGIRYESTSKPDLYIKHAALSMSKNVPIDFPSSILKISPVKMVPMNFPD